MGDDKTGTADDQAPAALDQGAEDGENGAEHESPATADAVNGVADAPHEAVDAADANRDVRDEVADEEGEEGVDEADEEDAGDEYYEEKVVVIRRTVFSASAAVAALLILGLAAANIYQMSRPPAAVATVDGARISRSEYDKAVARGDGRDILEGLITRKLVERDAAKNHVTVTPDEIDAKLKEAKAQVGTDDDWRQALDQQHTTELQVRETFRLNLMVQKLVFDKVKVADADIQKAYDQSKDTTYKGKSIDDVRAQIRQQIQDGQQQQALQAYIANLRGSARITSKVPGS